MMHKLYLLLRGIKRRPGAVGTRKPCFPVTIPLLKRLRPSIRRLYPDIAEQKMLWAACTLAFFGFLRSSEYTAPSTVKYHRKVTLRIRDVTLQKSKMLVRIKGSKTDPFRDGVTLTISKTGSFVCPIRAMNKYLPTHTPKLVHYSKRFEEAT